MLKMLKKLLLVFSLILPFTASALEYKGWTLVESTNQEDEYILIAVKEALTGAFLTGEEATAKQELALQCGHGIDRPILTLWWDVPMEVIDSKSEDYKIIPITWKIGNKEAFQSLIFTIDEHESGMTFLDLIPLEPSEWLNEKTWVFNATSKSGNQGTAVFDLTNLKDVIGIMVENCKFNL